MYLDYPNKCKAKHHCRKSDQHNAEVKGVWLCHCIPPPKSLTISNTMFPSNDLYLLVHRNQNRTRASRHINSTPNQDQLLRLSPWNEWRKLWCRHSTIIRFLVSLPRFKSELLNSVNSVERVLELFIAHLYQKFATKSFSSSESPCERWQLVRFYKVVEKFLREVWRTRDVMKNSLYKLVLALFMSLSRKLACTYR